MSEKSIHKETGMIFDIQKFCLHDGPGIRTTVFMKGCSLHCRWCANPESIKPYPQLMINSSRCIQCNICAEVCPTGAIILDSDNKIKRIRKSVCDFCLECAIGCPTEAIKIVGKQVTIKEVMADILKDELFYNNSGGGVTISGGEPLLQWEFVRGLLKLCKQEGIHTALETNGCSNSSSLNQILPFVDLLLFDIKHTDPLIHKSFTGKTNSQIMTNLRVAASRAKIWIRVPVVPGYNDSKQNITEVARIAKETGVEKVSLLPYHELGVGKYAQLGINYTVKSSIPSKAHLQNLQKIVSKQNVNVTIGY